MSQLLFAQNNWRVYLSQSFEQLKFFISLSEFKFDQPLDETLFSTEPPDGFAVEED